MSPLPETQQESDTIGVSIDRMTAMRFKVLVADDSSADQLLAQSRLGRSCCLDLVGSVTSGSMAISYLMGRGQYANRLLYPFPDLLLLDVDMPDMNGLEVLCWIRNQHFSVLRVVMLSGQVILTSPPAASLLEPTIFKTKTVTPPNSTISSAVWNFSWSFWPIGNHLSANRKNLWNLL